MIKHLIQWYNFQCHLRHCMMRTFRSCNNYHIYIYILSSFEFCFLREQIRSSDTSTGESGSEVEDITSPKASGNCINPILTPVQEEVSDHDIDLQVAGKQNCCNE